MSNLTLLTCINNLDDSFFNKCNKELETGFLTAFAHTVSLWVEPVHLATGAVLFIVFLPFLTTLYYNSKSGIQTVMKAFQIAHIHTLNFLFQQSYGLSLIISLYCIFQQQRPCVCNSIDHPDVFVYIGSKWGMPSGDVLCGTLFALFLMNFIPVYRIQLSLTAAVIVILKVIERLSLGFHSIGQVTSGFVLGVLLHYYQIYTPQYAIFIDVFIQLILAVIALPLAHLHFERDDPHNLISWWVGGFAFQVFVLFLIYRFYSKREWNGFKDSLKNFKPTSHYLQNSDLDKILLTKSHNHSDDSFYHNENESECSDSDVESSNQLFANQKQFSILCKEMDAYYIWGCCSVCLFIHLISYLFQSYGWAF